MKVENNKGKRCISIHKNVSCYTNQNGILEVWSIAICSWNYEDLMGQTKSYSYINLKKPKMLFVEFKYN